jgi:(p)ppGpp synthase/HD superfamily hydrolase
MSQVKVLEFVKGFADKSHGMQLRKWTAERYIVHPLRVMEVVREYNDNTPVLAAALLHDVLEDTPVTAAEMEEALVQVMDQEQTTETLKLVIELTDVFVSEGYPRLNRRSRKEKEADRLSRVSTDAQTIKYADIIDNVTDIVRQDADFAKIYVQEAKKMLLVMDAGHPALRTRATEIADQCLRELKKSKELL